MSRRAPHPLRIVPAHGKSGPKQQPGGHPAVMSLQREVSMALDAQASPVRNTSCDVLCGSLHLLHCDTINHPTDELARKATRMLQSLAKSSALYAGVRARLMCYRNLARVAHAGSPGGLPVQAACCNGNIQDQQVHGAYLRNGCCC